MFKLTKNGQDCGRYTEITPINLILQINTYVFFKFYGTSLSHHFDFVFVFVAERYSKV